MRALRIAGEAVRSIRSQPVASAGMVLVTALLCLVVLLTQGRTVGAARDVVASIDRAGTRTLVVRADPDSGLDSTVLDRMRALAGIEWAAAFGPAVDVQNQLLPGGASVPLREAWGDDLSRLGIRPAPAGVATAWATPDALPRLGMSDGVGSVAMAGRGYAVVGSMSAPDYLDALDVKLLAPSAPGTVGQVSVLVVVADHARLVAPIAAAVRSLLGVDDPTKVSVETSETLVSIRSTVEGELGDFGRALVGALFVLCGGLVAAIVYGLVMFRRRDFGRRRALGASKSLVLALVVSQVCGLSIVGSTAGSIVGVAALALGGDPVPPVEYVVALGTLAVAIASGAAFGPAVVASRREPIRELRVP